MGDWSKEDLGQGRMSDVDPDILYRSAQDTIARQVGRIEELEAANRALSARIKRDAALLREAVDLLRKVRHPRPMREHEDAADAFLARLDAEGTG